MKKILLILLLVSFVSAQELFTLKKDEITIVGDKEINIAEYIECLDNIWIMSLDNEDGNINIIGFDQEGNTDIKSLKYERIDEEEWNKYVLSISNFASRKATLNNELLEEKGPADLEAIEVAEQFIGMEGSCNKVAQAFINTYLGSEYSIYKTVSVSIEDAQPGDVIYYSDGGIGLQHWAVYLGGNSALQGNINGTTAIGSVYMNYGSEPQFLRPVLD